VSPPVAVTQRAAPADVVPDASTHDGSTSSFAVFVAVMVVTPIHDVGCLYVTTEVYAKGCFYRRSIPESMTSYYLRGHSAGITRPPFRHVGAPDGSTLHP
jgi:hypothetical protein